MNAITLQSLEPAPCLAVDTRMYQDHGQTLGAIGLLDRIVCWNLIRHLAANGWTVTSVFDGEERTKTAAPAEVMELVFNLDIAWLRCRQVGNTAKGSPFHDVMLVMGNGGWDLVSDWGYANGDPDGFNAVMDAFDAETLLTTAGLMAA